MIDVETTYDPLKKTYRLRFVHDKHAELCKVEFSGDEGITSIMKKIEAMSDAWTMTTAHKNIYVNAFGDMEKRAMVAEKKYQAARADYKQLLDDHLELLGVMKAK